MNYHLTKMNDWDSVLFVEVLIPLKEKNNARYAVHPFRITALLKTRYLILPHDTVPIAGRELL